VKLARQRESNLARLACSNLCPLRIAFVLLLLIASRTGYYSLIPALTPYCRFRIAPQLYPKFRISDCGMLPILQRGVADIHTILQIAGCSPISPKLRILASVFRIALQLSPNRNPILLTTVVLKLQSTFGP